MWFGDMTKRFLPGRFIPTFLGYGKKLATKENPKGYIKTVRNVGYIFSEK